MMVEEALHPHGPIGEICAGCGKEIGMLEGSYYRKMPGDDIGQTFHSMCGDPFGIGAKNAKIERLTAALAGLLEHLGPDGYIPGAGKPATDRARAALMDDLRETK